MVMVMVPNATMTAPPSVVAFPMSVRTEPKFVDGNDAVRSGDGWRGIQGMGPARGVSVTASIPVT